MHILLLWRYMISRLTLIENYCKRCGRWAEAFTVNDDLYGLVVPTGEEVCFRCFDAAARDLGHAPVWRVTMESGRAENGLAPPWDNCEVAERPPEI